MMNHARELMDKDNSHLALIGYKIWNKNGVLTPEELNEICKQLLGIDFTDKELLNESYELGHVDGYSEGYAAAREKFESEEDKERNEKRINELVKHLTR